MVERWQRDPPVQTWRLVKTEPRRLYVEWGLPFFLGDDSQMLPVAP